MWQEKSEKWKVQQEENLKSKKKQSIKRVEHGKSATFKQYNMKRVEHEKISKKSLTQKICNMKRMQQEVVSWKKQNTECKQRTCNTVQQRVQHGERATWGKYRDKKVPKKSAL